MKGTGVFLTDEEVEQLKALLREPVIMVGGYTPENPQVAVHRLALAHGLPEITGYYGADLTTKEIVVAS